MQYGANEVNKVTGVFLENKAADDKRSSYLRIYDSQ